MFVKKWRSLNHQCGDVVIQIVTITLIEPWSACRINKRSQPKPNFLENVEEDDDAQCERELIEVWEAITAIWECGLESDNDDERHMVYLSIVDEIPSQLNKPKNLANHFARLNTRLDSMDALLISYGE